MMKKDKNDFSVAEFVIAKKAEDDLKYHIMNKVLESVSIESDVVDELVEGIVNRSILKVYRNEIDKLIDE